MEEMTKIFVQKARLGDQLFEETGIEEEQISAAIDKVYLKYDYE